MSRAKAILVTVIPALLLLASVDCFGDSPCLRGHGAFGCLNAESGRRKQPPPGKGVDLAVQRWNRRAHVQRSFDDFSSPAAAALPVTPTPTPAFYSFKVCFANQGLAQCWQFHWRTASEPRAPSAAS